MREKPSDFLKASSIHTEMIGDDSKASRDRNSSSTQGKLRTSGFPSFLWFQIYAKTVHQLCLMTHCDTKEVAETSTKQCSAQYAWQGKHVWETTYNACGTTMAVVCFTIALQSVCYVYFKRISLVVLAFVDPDSMALTVPMRKCDRCELRWHRGSKACGPVRWRPYFGGKLGWWILTLC